MFGYLISALPVLLPLVFITATEWIFLRSLKRQDGSVDFFELGVLYSAVVFVYCLFPGIEFLSGGLSFSILGDDRLYRADPSAGQVAPIFWYYAGYLACFVFFYRKFRGTERREKPSISGLDPRLLWVLASGYACTYVFYAVLKAVWNLKTPETYNETYIVYNGLPVIVQKMANHMVGIAALLELLLMAYLVLNFSRYKKYIFLWLLIELVSIVSFGVGSRTGLMVLLLSLIITYNRFVKRLSWRTVCCIGVALLILFTGLGIVRTLSSPGDDRAFSFLGSANEFNGLFANAYDLRELKASGQTGDIFPRIYFADLARVVPEQLVPHGQLYPAQWYVQTFYPAYADQGGAFAFGAISECVVGLGWIDVIWRGLFVGWAFGYIRRLFESRENSFWNYALYLGVTVFSYETFRVTTFNLLPRALWMLLIWWSAKFLLGPLQEPHDKSPASGPDSPKPPANQSASNVTSMSALDDSTERS